MLAIASRSQRQVYAPIASRRSPNYPHPTRRKQKRPCLLLIARENRGVVGDRMNGKHNKHNNPSELADLFSREAARGCPSVPWRSAYLP